MTAPTAADLVAKIGWYAQFIPDRDVAPESGEFGVWSHRDGFVAALDALLARAEEAEARLRVVGDDYEAANLRAGLLTLRRLGLDTGDWLGQIEMRLPYVDQVPNRSVDDQVVQVQARAEAAESRVAALTEALRREKRLRIEMSELLGEAQIDACYARAALAAADREAT